MIFFAELAKGLQRAGFHVTGVDIKAQPRYCGDVFIQGDALEADLRGYDLVCASPPCQGYSRMRHLPWLKGRQWPLLIDPIREKLTAANPKAWIIENVEDAPLSGIVLCGQMFGLKVYRHRRFESNLLLMAPAHESHRHVIGRGRMLNDRATPSADGMVSHAGKGSLRNNYHSETVVTVGGQNFKYAAGAAAMGIDWMTRGELAQAIPPDYSHFLGMQVMRILLAAERDADAYAIAKTRQWRRK